MTENPVEFDQVLKAAIEGKIGEVVRRDVVVPRPAPEVESAKIGSLLQQVAGTSVEEIDALISQLQTLRSHLEVQGARVWRKVADVRN